jgi:predicted ferric reductase
MARGTLLIALYIAVATLPLWLATWLDDGSEGVLYDVGRNLGLTGFMILILQFVLAARIKWIERAFGLDILIRYHQHIAIAAVCFLLLHPILLALGGSGWELLLGLDLPWSIWVGKAALILLGLNVLLSLKQSRLGLSFEKWRLGHDILGPALLVLVVLHSWFAGSDLGLASMRVLWIGAFFLAGGIFLHHRFLRPYLLRRHAYQVRDVRQETDDVWTVELTPPKGGRIEDFLPGQFHFLTFFRDPSLPVEEHHWTISSSPARKDSVSSTIKEAGDFTATIGRTKPGDTAAVHGPFGRFSHLLHPEERDLVFLAGGIGITPLMGMLRHMRDTGDTRTVTLFYANRREEDILFRKELEDMATGDHPRLSLINVLSRPGSDWMGESGRLNEERIKKYCGPNLREKSYYVCGPLKMARDLIETLKRLGIPDNRIRREIFSFLD